MLKKIDLKFSKWMDITVKRNDGKSTVRYINNGKSIDRIESNEELILIYTNEHDSAPCVIIPLSSIPLFIAGLQELSSQESPIQQPAAKS